VENALVTVIIPCRNEAGCIEACLRSVLKQEPPPGGFEIIVADGLSDDGTRELLARLCAEEPSIRMVDNPQRITPAGLNVAIRAARGSVIVRMDAHTEYAPDYIRCCLEVLTRTGADNVGGPARTKTASRVQEVIAAAYHSPLVVGGARFHDAAFEGPVDTVTYGCWRREAFEKFGFFDEELVRNQDDEHNLRITRAGGHIYQSPSIRSWYQPRSSLIALFRQYSQYGYWKVRVIRKHRIPASLRHLVPGAFVGTVLLLMPLAIFMPWARWILVALLAAYGLANLAASLDAARRGGVRCLPLLPVVVICYQIGYGWGFLRGLMDFVLFRRAPVQSATRLTRA
jgi:glycosyltransferase involved in cell wall biosynthesis